MKKQDEIRLFDDIEACFRDTEEIYKLSSFISKYCELNKDSEDLYEVSSVSSILTEKVNELSLNLYRIMQNNDKTETLGYIKLISK